MKTSAVVFVAYNVGSMKWWNAGVYILAGESRFLFCVQIAVAAIYTYTHLYTPYRHLTYSLYLP